MRLQAGAKGTGLLGSCLLPLQLQKVLFLLGELTFLASYLQNGGKGMTMEAPHMK